MSGLFAPTYEEELYEEVLQRIARGEPRHMIFRNKKTKSPLPESAFYLRKYNDPEYAERIVECDLVAADGMVHDMLEIADTGADIDRVPHQIGARKFAVQRLDRARILRMERGSESDNIASSILCIDDMGVHTKEAYMKFLAMRMRELDGRKAFKDLAEGNEYDED